jgi:hypothetical protein
MGKRKRPEAEVRGSIQAAAVDARSLVPVSDEIGGVVIYIGGRPSYYVLNGEWFAAVAEPPAIVRPGHDLSSVGESKPTEIVSTS